MSEPTPAQRIELVIRTYIQACNDADAKAIAACFSPEAVHYSPSGPKWVGAATIGTNFAQRVQEKGQCWTVDQLVIDVDRCAATLEWTRFDPTTMPSVLRGVDWFVFEPNTFRIREIRPYIAAPLHPEKARQELLDFDYAGRGYPTTFPAPRTR
ncbi:MAG: nuclear transport factor 2 family protein [Candidatus Rokubacteria bacterium]|nr:nuclear transport factor 2 family protein [Candidatus Rokubacteria bacterium]